MPHARSAVRECSLPLNAGMQATTIRDRSPGRFLRRADNASSEHNFYYDVVPGALHI